MANVRDFQYVREIARYGSISKAASALYLTQPTLTKFLQRLEAEVGSPLFHRVGKKFLLTPAGELYVAKADSILRLNRQLEEELNDLRMMRSGSIRLGATAGRINYIVTTVLPLFRSRYPGVRMVVEMNHTRDLLKMIFNNELDVALANYAGEQPELSHEFIGEDELVLVVPADSELAAAAEPREGHRFPVTSPPQWADEPFILPSYGSRSLRLAQEYFNLVGVQPNVVAEITGIQGVMEAVRSGLGISIFTSVPQGQDGGLAYLSLGRRDLPKQRVAVITRKGICFSEPQRALMDIFRCTYQ